MDNLLKDDIKGLYLKYLSAAFGSALISSIYGVVDMAMVGQYQGPDGTAALAVVAPVWNIIYSLGLLMGIGGSVIFSLKRGTNNGKEGNENEYFTSSLIGSVVLSVVMTVLYFLFEDNILTFFGANEVLLVHAKNYMRPIKYVLPVFLFNQMLAAYLRNDGAPSKATKAVMTGGIFNVFGDYFFVFPCDMGLFGAGLATAMGSGFSLLIMLTHFFSKKNTLRIKRPQCFFHQIERITVTGFSTFFIDVAMGILTILFNKQIMKYLDASSLAVYGPIINISTFVQCSAYSIGQASQPIISTNYGAGYGGRIKETLRYSIITTAVFGLFWTLMSMAIPNVFIRIFMSPTEEILSIAPAIIRTYAVSFLILPFNIYSTYYFQAIMKPKTAFVVSVMRGLVISGALILILPLVFAPSSLWWSMPLTEALTIIYVIVKMKAYTESLPC